MWSLRTASCSLVPVMAQTADPLRTAAVHAFEPVKDSVPYRTPVQAGAIRFATVAGRDLDKQQHLGLYYGRMWTGTRRCRRRSAGLKRRERAAGVDHQLTSCEGWLIVSVSTAEVRAPLPAVPVNRLRPRMWRRQLAEPAGVFGVRHAAGEPPSEAGGAP